MIELIGRFGTAKVFNDYTDGETQSQIIKIMNSNLAINSKVRIMPDTHAGKGGPIGLTMTIVDKVSPSLVGADISCGIALYTSPILKDVKIEDLDTTIHEAVPTGYKLNTIDWGNISSSVPNHIYDWLYKLISRLRCVSNDSKDINIKLQLSEAFKKALRGFGTLGGGNHFIELYNGFNENDPLILSVHTGSRSIGGYVYKYYERRSNNESYNVFMKERTELLEKLKSEGRFSEISGLLAEHKKEFQKTSSIDSSITYLEGELMNDYIHDVGILNEYAERSRHRIVFNIIKHYAKEYKNIDIPDETYDETLDIARTIVDKPHNYIDVDRMILRKGSQSSENFVIIPINMRDGVIVGKFTNSSIEEDWNFSAPHGAGRKLTRTAAKNTLSVDDFRKQMKGIYSTTISEDTLDEAPDAYKSIDEIKESILGSISIEHVLKPIYNFKGGSEMPDWKSLKGSAEEDILLDVDND
jgi:tRNA-splicing ligase RtcB (3'-phosphate/5'-hydroxy nucleic acid ligase)